MHPEILRELATQRSREMQAQAHRARWPGCSARSPIPRYPSGVITVERVQTGVRMEKRLLKVLKAFAEYHDMTLGDLLEGIVLHAFEGDAPFSPETLQAIVELKKIYGCTLTAADSHQLREPASQNP